MAVEESLHKWQEKLLDLGRGNQLINFRESKSRTIKIYNNNYDDIFDRIVNGESIPFFDTDEYFKNKAFVDDDDEIEDEEIVVCEDVQSVLDQLFETKKSKKKSQIEIFADTYKKRDILAYKPDGSLKKTLRNLKRLADSSLTERGINILYVAFGFITWADKNSPKDKDLYRSPLLLVPISLTNDNKTLPYYLNLYDDDVTTNPSLIYKFRNDFNIEIPEYDSTTNESLSQYLDRVEEEMSSCSFDCEIETGAQIGLFSFLKISMYEDIKNNWNEVVNNKAIRKILGNEPVYEHYEDIDYDEYFKKGEEIKLHNVVDADSSQLRAIVASKSGRDVVLQGPPGTGKSQTITNLIAEFLADGKKILFVSEKLAALEVVYNNLKKAGIANFCLELHSNKANKKDVIDELYSTLENGISKITNDAYEELNLLQKNKGLLDSYVYSMHTPIEGLGKTPYEINGLVYQYKDSPKTSYRFSDISRLGYDFYKFACDILSGYANVSPYVEYHFWENPWYGFNKTYLASDKEDELDRTLSISNRYLNDLKLHLQAHSFTSILHIESLDDLNSYNGLLQFLSSIDHYFVGLLDADRCANSIKIISDFKNKYDQFQKDLFIVSKVFVDDIYNINVSPYLIRINKYKNNIFRAFNSSYKSAKKYIEQFGVTKGKRLSPKTLVGILSKVQDVEKERKNIESQKQDLCNWFNLDPNIKVEQIFDLKNEFTSYLNNFSNFDLSAFINYSYGDFRNLQSEMNDQLGWLDKNYERSLSVNSLQSYFHNDICSFSSLSINDAIEKTSSLINNFSSLRQWIRVSYYIEQIRDNGLFDFLVSSIKQGIPNKQLIVEFSGMFYTQWQEYLYSSDEILRNFNRRTQDSNVKSFREKDKLRFDISRAQIYSKLTATYPSMSDASITGTQANILSREHMKQRKIRPVRYLFRDCGQLIQRLKPCFLMSPLSVSTYLTYDTCQFDVVIFDEASQIFPWDAVGAIYRAKQVIVVGDSKQMPPSNYFMTELEDNEDEDDYDDSTEGFESILDICSSNFDRMTLNWHYRSKTEDLIAFSNRNFYDDSLITFPSIHKNKMDLGIDFIYVENGLFNRRTHSNEKEAEKVVDLVFEHFKKYPNRSLGVVAFSIKQQEEIEDAINKRRDKDPSFEKFFSTDLKEPFFVKNLETVQGDERDTIIFSIAYGYDEDGKFLHNFGPLNREGGERRLNVAVTRAKLNVKVVASIKASDIDLSRTNSLGAKLLRDYLSYAEKGITYGVDNIIDNANEKISFEKEISDFLKEKGYNFERHVGCSSYRIDFAIRHPKTGDFVLAIECDGEMYASAKTTRDRDRLRQEVLEKLGWSFYRIWSSEWILNKGAEEDSLVRAINDSILSYDKGGRGEFESNSEYENDDDFEYSDASIFQIRDFTEQTDDDESGLISHFPTYPYEADFELFETLSKHNSFYTQYNSRNVDFLEILTEVVKKEQPITEELLLKRCATICCQDRVTPYVWAAFDYFLKKSNSHIHHFDDYYTTDDALRYYNFRVPKDDDKPRRLTQISKYELAGGMITIVKYLDGVTKEGIYNSLVRLAGFKKLGSTMYGPLEEAYKVFRRSPNIRIDSNGQHFYIDD